MSGLAVLRGARAAVVFLTRVPVGGYPYREEELRWAAGWFPLVGAGLGAAMGAVFLATERAGAAPAALCALAAGLLLTGAFHEDGLADTADALGGAYDREKLFVILKDSRIGSFGAAALFVVLALRVALLGELAPSAFGVLVVTQACARLAPVWMMVALPYVTRGEAAKSRDLARAGLPQAALATSLTVGAVSVAVALGALTCVELAAMVGAAGTIAVLASWRFVVRAGGLTGDFLGATEQLTECAMLLALAWLRAPGG